MPEPHVEMDCDTQADAECEADLLSDPHDEIELVVLKDPVTDILGDPDWVGVRVPDALTHVDTVPEPLRLVVGVTDGDREPDTLPELLRETDVHEDGVSVSLPERELVREGVCDNDVERETVPVSDVVPETQLEIVAELLGVTLNVGLCVGEVEIVVLRVLLNEIVGVMVPQDETDGDGDTLKV